MSALLPRILRRHLHRVDFQGLATNSIGVAAGLFGVVTAAAAAGSTGNGRAGCAECSTSAATRSVPLAARHFRPEPSVEGQLPTLVLIHGMDSWGGTWQNCARELASRGFYCVALDLRGHGESPLGQVAEFGPQQLAADIRSTLISMGIVGDRALSGKRIVFVGHSMGARVAMRYAADYPQDLSALILEDMDCQLRDKPKLSAYERDQRSGFPREFSSWEQARLSLIDVTMGGSPEYSLMRVNSWRTEDPARVFKRGRTWWSAINPEAQLLARETVICSSDGLEAMHRIAAVRVRPHGEDLAVHVFVAGDNEPVGTVCRWGLGKHGTPEGTLLGSVHDMASMLPGLQITHFPRAGHTIHGHSSLDNFVDAVVEIASPIGR